MGKNLLDRARQGVELVTPDYQRPVVQPGDAAEREIASLQSQLAMVMPNDGETGRRLISDAIQLIRKTPRLRQCSPESVMGGLVTLAQLDLRPGVGGEAWLIPMSQSYRTPDGGWAKRQEAQLIIGYQGHATLARRSELLGDVQVIRIYENDRLEFSWDYDRLVHEVNWQDSGQVVGWYAVVKLTNGITRVERPWTVADMEYHRDRYAMAKKKDGTVVGPWRDNFNAMADKTVLLRALKNAPRSYALQQGMFVDGGVRTNTQAGADLFEVTTPREEVEGEVMDDQQQEEVPADAVAGGEDE